MDQIKNHLKKVKPYHIISILAVAGIAFVAMNPTRPPLFTNSDNFILFASEELKLEQGVQVSSGDLGSNKEVDIEKDSIISGNLFADEITIDKNTTINGNASFNKLKLYKDAKILGTQTKSVQLPIANLPDIPDFQIGTQDFKFEGQDNTLAPGNYQNLTLEKNRRLTLTGGIYNINKLFLKGNSTLIFSAPTTLNIRKELKGQEHIAVLPDKNLKPDDLKINYQGKNEKEEQDKKDKDENQEKDKDKNKEEKENAKPVEFGKESFLNFKLLAPKAEVHIGENSTLRGQVMGREVKVGKEAVLSREETFVKESNPAKVIENAGIKFVANEIIILFRNEASQADVQQIAESVNGSIIGFIPLPKIVKIEVQTTTTQELNSKIQIIKNLNNPLIIGIVQNLVGE